MKRETNVKGYTVTVADWKHSSIFNNTSCILNEREIVEGKRAQKTSRSVIIKLEYSNFILLILSVPEILLCLVFVLKDQMIWL